jgi:hypothetical protein
MAPKIKNAAAIAQANAANAAAQASAAAAQAKAAAADAARRPVLQQTVAGIGGINKAVQATLAALNNPKSSQAAIDKAFAESKAALAANKANLATITPEQRAMAIEQGNIYTTSMADFDKYNAMIVDVPTAILEDTTTSADRDAFALIKSTLKTYGFTEAEIAELDTFIEAGLTDGKMGPEQLKLQLRELPTYKARFSGNTARVSAGLNALSEADYLQQENDYSEIFKMYGVGNLSSRAQFSSLIGGNISVTEVTKRVDAAVKRVKNGDPAVLTTLRTLYPNITDTDIVSYFLKPGEMLPELERKTTVAEIGATAGQFGMKETGLAKFEDLQRYGVTLATARAGYGTIAEELPGATKLGNIYGETGITYGQTEAEAEQFKSSAEAKRKKEKLIETEKSSFKGSAGLNTGGLSTQYLRRSSSAGQF